MTDGDKPMEINLTDVEKIRVDQIAPSTGGEWTRLTIDGVDGLKIEINLWPVSPAKSVPFVFNKGEDG